MTLPTSWIDKIFEKLTLVYGQAFLARWRDISIAAVKADWAHELAFAVKKPEAIAYALSHLPAEKPPTVLQFRDLCLQCPASDSPRLDSPKADSKTIAEELEKLEPAQKQSSNFDPKSWAKTIIKLHESGLKLNPTRLLFARQALGMM